MLQNLKDASMLTGRRDIINQLQKDILLLQGFRPHVAATGSMGLGPVEAAFPNGIFPTGAVHEFISNAVEQSAATGGFLAGLLGPLMKQGGACIWISASRTLFPPALKSFGVQPDQVVFIDLEREKDVLWAMEEALKCEGLAAVVGEVKEIGFTASRRLQLAVEQSRVTGFLLRYQPRNLHAIACVARWSIKPLASKLEAGMPGVGFPRWEVELQKVRNGRPGIWEIEWGDKGFRQVPAEVPQTLEVERRKIG